MTFVGLGAEARRMIKFEVAIHKAELDIVAATVCDTCDITLPEFLSKDRTEQLSDARKIFIHLCRGTVSKYTCSRLGMYMGRDHSSITYAEQRAEVFIKVDPSFKELYYLCRERARQRLKLNGYEYR